MTCRSRRRIAGLVVTLVLALAAVATPQPAETTADPWGFAEEEAAPTSLDLARQQAVDIVFVSSLAALALVGFFRKSEPIKLATLVGSVCYLGIYKSQIISITNICSALVGDLPIFTYSMAWYVFAIFAVVSTLLWGRLYCGRLCAFGALTQLMDLLVPARLRVNVPPAIERRAAYIKYGILAGALSYFLITRDISFYRYIEPFWMFTFRASTALWVGLGVLLFATIFVRNLYCRFLCPVGAALGVVSSLTTVFRIKRWAECRTCKACERVCEWGAIQGPTIIRSECVRCDDCERLYLDTQKCPHWIIIQRKSDIMARQSALTAP